VITRGLFKSVDSFDVIAYRAMFIAYHVLKEFFGSRIQRDEQDGEKERGPKTGVKEEKFWKDVRPVEKSILPIRQ
jgi:hypothetical protein